MDKKKKWLALAEQAVVILITVGILEWGRQGALIERGCTAYGGECLLILIPVIYYILKSMKK